MADIPFPFFQVPELSPLLSHSNFYLTLKHLLLFREDPLQTESFYTNRFFMTPSIATKFQYILTPFIFYFLLTT
jgi:hypothetical protein